MQLQSFVARQVAGGRRQRRHAARRDDGRGRSPTPSAEGLDYRGDARHARNVGGPNLRELTFHERAALLKALAKILGEHKDEFYQLSYATGATKSDSWIDIDGGISTLFVYASKGTRELPNSRVYVDGAVEALSKTGTLRRAAHLRAARGRGGSHQRLQLSGVGNAGEAGAGAARRRPGDRQAGDRDLLSDRARGAAHRRVRHPARGRAAADLRGRRRSVRSPDLPGRGLVHRLCLAPRRSCASIR